MVTAVNWMRNSSTLNVTRTTVKPDDKLQIDDGWDDDDDDGHSGVNDEV